MDDALRMRFFQSGAHLQSQVEPLALGQAAEAIEHRPQVFAFHELHRRVGNAVDAVELVDAAHILVRDLAGEQKFALESVDHGPIGGDFRFQEFQGDDLARLAVARLVDLSHGAASGFAQNVVTLPEQRQAWVAGIGEARRRRCRHRP